MLHTEYTSYRLMAEKCQQALLCWRFTLSDVVEDRNSKRNYSSRYILYCVPVQSFQEWAAATRATSQTQDIQLHIISKAKVGPPSVQLQYHSDSRASTFHSRLLVPPIIHLICTNCGLCCAVAGTAGYCNNVRVITRVSQHSLLYLNQE